MYNNKKISVIIAAAGAGNRMGSGIPKQYMEIGGVPVIVKTVEAFKKNGSIDAILVVVNKDFMSHCSHEFQRFGLDDVEIIEGGAERQDSVYKGLMAMPETTEYVIIHDGARPYVSDKIIENILSGVIEKNAVVTAVPVKDTITRQMGFAQGTSVAEKETSARTEYLDRGNLYAVQTPQAFEKKLIMKAFNLAFEEKFYGTDDGMLVERTGEKVYIVPGDYANIKITTKEDLPMECRVGSGYDVHQLVEGRKLILGGVEIPFEKGLLGHSDADVLVHAIMDALLGGAALGDIGRHFPDTQEEYAGISSIALLKKVKEMVFSAGYTIGNIDATLICQRPRISAYVSAMTRNIGEALDLDEGKINIKGTTTEKLGFIGREEGIAAEAVCLLNK